MKHLFQVSILLFVFLILLVIPAAADEEQPLYELEGEWTAMKGDTDDVELDTTNLSFRFRLIPTDFTETETLAKDSYIPYSYMELEVYSYFLSGHTSFTLFRNGELFSSTTWPKEDTSGKHALLATLYKGSFPDGYYEVFYTGFRTTISGTTTYTFRSSFYVDATAPTLEGTFQDPTNAYVKRDAVIELTDSGSGPKTLYVKRPGSSTFENLESTTFTFQKSDSEGLYIFVGEDLAGTTSKNTYVFLDATAPELSFTGENIQGGMTNASFQCIAEDPLSGVFKIEYKSLNSSTWEPYTGGSLESSLEEDIFAFRATDNAQNVSSTFYLYWRTTAPSIYFYDSERQLALGGAVGTCFWFYTDEDGENNIRSYVKCPNTDSFEETSSGTLFEGAGIYLFYCEDVLGNRSQTETFLLDDAPPEFSFEGCTPGVLTTEPFRVSCSDLSGYALYMKTLDEEEWTPLFEGYFESTNTTEANIYLFYAEDAFYQVSDTYTILYEPPIPSIELDYDEHINVFYVHFQNCVSQELNGSPCEQDLTLDGEGSYVAKAFSQNGTEVEVPFDLIHKHNPVSFDGTTITYECVTCGDTYTLPYEGTGTWSCERVHLGCSQGIYDVYTNEETKETISCLISLWDHQTATEETPATCCESGLRTTYCPSCGLVFSTEILPAIGHTLKEIQEDPTCASHGRHFYRCSTCGYEEQMTILPARDNHTVETLELAPTCTEDGYLRHVCSVCGLILDETLYTKTGHTLETERKEKTCTQDATLRTYCTNCSYETIEILETATGHHFLSELLCEPTCTEKGERVSICSICGESLHIEIPSFGHSYIIEDTKDDEGNLLRTKRCTVCGITEVTELDNLYIGTAESISFLFEKYAPYIIVLLLSTTGVCSLAMGISILFTTDENKKMQAKRRIAVYLVGLVVLFLILGCGPYLIRGIASLFE